MNLSSTVASGRRAANRFAQRASAAISRRPAGVLILAALLATPFGAQYAHGGTPTFAVSSPDLTTGQFDKKFTLNAFGCTGSNVSPRIQWSNLPAGTRSLALQVEDRDAAAGNAFWHWTVYNIPASENGLPQGAGNAADALPALAFGGANDFLDTGATGANGNYGGPCPPVGEKPHHYVFTLYALAVDNVETASGIPKTGSPNLHSFILNKGLGDKLLGKATFTATYGR
ncbi:Raf kinase inhibitor-like protein, YbhB/YbcL family [Burkholderia sp. OK233]|nr:Raf kinase inhibitor-like protein, YbhB/YbcL family [Burkholderia sp. OK233]